MCLFNVLLSNWVSYYLSVSKSIVVISNKNDINSWTILTQFQLGLVCKASPSKDMNNIASALTATKEHPTPITVHKLCRRNEDTNVCEPQAHSTHNFYNGRVSIFGLQPGQQTILSTINDCQLLRDFVQHVQTRFGPYPKRPGVQFNVLGIRKSTP